MKKMTSECIKKTEQNWYIFYTHPRAEKVAYKHLLDEGYNAFLPLKKEVHEWKNRQQKIVEIPLFPNYIFVNTTVYNIYSISRSKMISTCITCGDKPSIISDSEIQMIHEMVSIYQDIYVGEELMPGYKVRIIKGPLKGFEGVLSEKKGKHRFGIQLKQINQSVSVDIDIKDIEKI